uniref:Uncharacterized protein n=1 Tax=Physcomitrium patens TaxID=3218 RepID=A0A2K1JCV2_PHYPA|nr:hypothetical protein PHYPA_019632 [Physcomitrium patens]
MHHEAAEDFFCNKNFYNVAVVVSAKLLRIHNSTLPSLRPQPMIEITTVKPRIHSKFDCNCPHSKTENTIAISEVQIAIHTDR